MGFFNKIRTAFGFSDGDVEAELNGDDMAKDATVTPLRQLAPNGADKPEQAATEPQSSPSAGRQLPELPKQLPEDLFLSVVKIINEQLPPFFKNNIDEQAQAQQIHDALDASHKEYIKSLSDAVEKRTAMMWEQDRNSLNEELKQLREKSRQVESKSEEWKTRQLSAERQKRALTDRVKDLMLQIDALQAEKEQFDLENKSLVNKIRVMSTQGDDADQLKADNQYLRQEVNKLKAKLSAGETSAPNDGEEALLQAMKRAEEAESAIAAAKEEISSLNEQIKSLNESIVSHIAQIETLTGEKLTLASERDSLASDIDTFKKRCEIADSMINELQSKASEANISESTNNELTKQINEKNQEIEALRAELAETNESIKDIEQIIGQFEDFKKEKDAVIESLKSTIQNNLLTHAQQESELKAQIQTLKEQLYRSAAAAESRADNAAGKEPIKLPDDDFDELNWLVSTPPAGTNARTSLPDSEFGYREPKRPKSTDVDPSQMSLF